MKPTRPDILTLMCAAIASLNPFPSGSPLYKRTASDPETDRLRKSRKARKKQAKASRKKNRS
jgi:hypothetical protein